MDIRAWALILALLIYIPIVCYKDWKYREIKHDVWIALGGVCSPILLSLFITGEYQLWMLIISLVSIIIYFMSMKLHVIEGADFMYLMFISLFFIYNPISGHWFMALPFNIFLIATTFITGFIVMWSNLITGKGLSFEFKDGIPMMFPISAALILTAVLA